MSSEWKQTTVGEQATLQRGFDITKAAQRAGQVPVVSSAGISSWHDTAMVRGPGVVLGRKGVVGSVHFVRQDYWPHDTSLWVKDFHGNDESFVYYFFLAHAKVLSALDVGSANPTLNRNHVHPIAVSWPGDLEEQVAIAKFLGSLDDRITLLRETNVTLEAISQALFKSWFVDFDPVRAKSQGLVPEGLDEATAALFPDSFEESALGLVPKGWRAGSIGDFAQLTKGTVNPGNHPDKLFDHYSLPAFDKGQRPMLERGEMIKSNKTPVPPDAVLLSKLNPHIPRVWLPGACGPTAVCSTEFLVFQSIGVGSRELIYSLFSSPDFVSRLQQLVTGTSNSHQRIKPDQVALMNAVVPSSSVAKAFESVTRVLFDRVQANREKELTLSTLRDTLLPRLISGQLRLPEMEAPNA
ncbi:restriction endonuclease subunit S [Roseateles albus]|uniref:Restriction endonuclease subunit S n=1 Tax=Roseateles albus TaxID=2987525 RepID=A0ABT5KHM1_9BURK|nr:restriction endonuclease subunit S [Roseateles albus]MDC8773350.1 restriction endonuclease subunit S [Roseateles albus]